jgi:hypothetical protein
MQKPDNSAVKDTPIEMATLYNAKLFYCLALVYAMSSLVSKPQIKV